MVNHPFWQGGVRTWTAGKLSNRWECDDFANSADYNTLHRIWTRTQTTDPDSSKTSCKAWRDAGATRSGIYWLYDTSATTTPYKAYCDMETDGGGWTLILKVMTNNTGVWGYSGSAWSPGTPFNENDFNISPSNGADALYKTYTRVPGTQPAIQFLAAGRIPLPASGSAQTAKDFATGTSIYAEASATGGGSGCNFPSQLGTNSVTLNPVLKIQKVHGRIGSNLNPGTSLGGGHLPARVRFGFIGNETLDVITPDSAIGSGIEYAYPQASVSFTVSAGYGVYYDSCGASNGSGFYKVLLWLR